ncbi:DUF4132 domain-containing protein [Kribbella sp. NPDC056861]|uniref:DUF4132 domain-containing protein n=1 Tax=Kribbella sp. NPDC056861 TaxID=3154857 RepID=UPI00342D4E60
MGVIGRLLGRLGDSVAGGAGDGTGSGAAAGVGAGNGAAGAGSGVSAEWRKALRVVLKRLDGGPVTISSAVESYLLTGEPDSALAMVVGNTDAHEALRLWGHTDRTTLEDADRKLWNGLRTLPPAVLLRLARLIESVTRAGSPRFFNLDPVGGAPLAEALLIYLTAVGGGVSHAVRQALPFDHATMEAMLAEAGADRSDLLVAAFRPSQSWGASNARSSVRLLNGFGPAVVRHAEVLRPLVGVRGVENQLLVLELLPQLTAEELSLFATEVAELATSTSSQVRSKATSLVAKIDAVEPLKVIASEGKPEERLNALQLLWSGADTAVRDWAREHAAADRAPKVRALLEEWDRSAAGPEQPAVVIEKPVIDWTVPLTDELVTTVQTGWQSLAQQIEQLYRNRGLVQLEGPVKLIEALRAGSPPALVKTGSKAAPFMFGDRITSSFPLSELGLAGATILLNQLGVLTDHSNNLSDPACLVYNTLRAQTGKPSLLEISTALDALGLDGPTLVFDRYCRAWGVELGRSWPDEDVAPFVQANLPIVSEALTAPQRAFYHSDDAPYRALATLPGLPPAVVDVLVGVALGSRKATRRPAQDALTKVPGIGERAAAGLKDGKADVRTVAAQWLARLGDPAAVPALEAAVRREKQDVPQGALLDALETLGQPVEKYLDRDGMTTQAAAALAKGLPKELDWLQWELVPAVRWADSGEPVPVNVLKWFAVQAVKAKSPEPNAMLRKYCSMLEPVDREAFGQYLLEGWLAADLRPVTLEEAHAKAQQEASQKLHYLATYPQHYANDPAIGKSLEQLTAEALPWFAGQPAGSAIGSKGLLALVASCAREGAADPVARYLKEWYGQRAPQGKALIGMLGWIDHPSATQLMLSIGARFRTKSFQEEATKQAGALAERKGWSVGELADRTIPTAGFDESGVIELSYGERVFTPVLRPELTIELRSPEGKKIASLPAPRQSEDEAVVKAAKKVLTTAKKELKAIVQLQTQRLYEALCTERTWSYDDWETYLNQHPVVRHLTRRLAWVATTADDTTVFRPLDDGTLTDVDDNEVKLPADAVIAVAHDSLLDQEVVQAWQEHLADYEVNSLFQQFGKGTFVLPEKSSAGSELRDFNGHLLEAFALRGRAGKLGYTRGAAQDAGWFYEYEKRFPTLGLTAVVTFTGNPLPETNRTVALNSLSFLKTSPGGQPAGVQLSDVPKVLLSEAYNDLRLMASDGTGFDPDWERKSEY